jgi:protein-L-isoaspartate O-methyltransferase
MEPSPAEPPAGVSPRFWALLGSEPLTDSAVLDVGTGTGRLALALAPCCRLVVGIDRDVDAIEEATRRAETGLTNVDFVLDAEAPRTTRPTGPSPEFVVAHRACPTDHPEQRPLADIGCVLAFVASTSTSGGDRLPSRRVPRTGPTRAVCAGFVVET